jgi:glycosyltransferase involved in cell wall biosynthesis
VRLLIQIPCLDEEASLPATLGDLPRAVPGFDEVAIVVVDDGSRDRTSEIAQRHGAHVVRVPYTRGLAHAFMTGIETCLARGADVVVNTDADNQYAGGDVAQLVAPILEGRADVVIGARPIASIASFSPTKRLLQRLGSWTVRRLSRTGVADATSGFRAFSREAALRLNVFSRYTYTLETIVQAAERDLRIVSVPVRTNPVTRRSRLVRSTFDYVWRNGVALVRMSVVYRPFRFFMIPALASFALATAIGLRFLVAYLAAGGVAGHVQSLILMAVLYGIAAALGVVAFLGDLFTINRRLLEDLQLQARRQRFDAAGGRETPLVAPRIAASQRR